MPRRFEGMSDAEWELVEDIFPGKARKSRGMPAAHPLKILNLMLFILATSCRWCDLPRGGQWASKSASCRWLKTWHSDGRLNELQARLTALFPCGKGGGAGVAHGYKGKGVLIHLLVDADERKHVGKLLEAAAAKTGKAGRPRKRKNVRRLAANKAYDADAMINFLKKKGIKPQIPRKRNAGRRGGRLMSISAPRFQVERTFLWLQRKFRRIIVRWERLPDCFDAFLSLALCFFWVQRLVG